MPSAISAAPIDAWCARLRESQLGRYAPVETPWGIKPLVYADDTASGRTLGVVEEVIATQMLPYYANTHSESSFGGRYTGALRESARETIRTAMGARPEHCVIFVGAGATGAINLLCRAMGLLGDERRPNATTDYPELPVVFIGPYEHHANILPWREAQVELVVIGEDARGGIDQQALATALEAYKARPLLIGSFSAASNVTGLVSDVGGITRLLKQYGALAFWDYAAAGPYLPIQMTQDQVTIDAVFLSPHKFPGGPASAGVLIVDQQLFERPRPVTVGGGAVSYVTPTEHVWRRDIEGREEAGTPDIVGAVRAGIAIAIKDKIGVDLIEHVEQEWRRHAVKVLSTVPAVEILGPAEVKALPIFSIQIRVPKFDSQQRPRVLHYGFVVALLNDLFGIQVRGGCSCAGPYAHRLLSLDAVTSEAIATELEAGRGCLRPGWVRFNLHWLMSRAEVDYVLEALRLVAERGWRLLASYRLDAATGIWSYRDATAAIRPSVDGLLESMLVTGTSKRLSAMAFEPTQLLADARHRLDEGASETHWAQARVEWQSPALRRIPSHLRWFASPFDHSTDECPMAS